MTRFVDPVCSIAYRAMVYMKTVRFSPRQRQAGFRGLGRVLPVFPGIRVAHAIGLGIWRQQSGLTQDRRALEAPEVFFKYGKIV